MPNDTTKAVPEYDQKSFRRMSDSLLLKHNQLNGTKITLFAL